MVIAADTGVGGAFNALLPFVLIFVVFYFLLILPQRRQRQKTQEMLANLKTGDRVITTGGVYGTIAGFRDSVVQLQVASQVKIDVARTAIAGLQEADGGPKREDAASKSKK